MGANPHLTIPSAARVPGVATYVRRGCVGGKRFEEVSANAPCTSTIVGRDARCGFVLMACSL